MSCEAQRRVRRTLLTVFVILAGSIAGTSVAAPTSAKSHLVVKPSQELAVLLGSHEAMSRPSKDAAPLMSVPARGPITGAKTVLPVIGHRTDADGIKWLHVMLPGRPNGHTGWIAQGATAVAATGWQIVVDTAERRVLAYNGGRLVRSFGAVVGKASTPTPHGRFFVEETIQLRATEPGAPFALALSARSNVLQEFDGGPGQIALHGVANIGGTLGTAISHGCVRLDAAAMWWLVVRIGPGAPVTITG